MIKDLQLLTGSLSNSVTQLTWNLVKMYGDKKELLNYIGYCSDKSLKEELRRLINADNKESEKDTIKENSLRFSHSEWLNKSRR